MELTKKQKREKMRLEIKDLLAGTAFPLMLQLIFSASVILFADYSADMATQLIALVFGEALLIAAYIVFGRANGVTAVRRYFQNSRKRELFASDPAALSRAAQNARQGNLSDLKAIYKTGEYALYKGFLIGFFTTVPFLLFQIVQGIAPNSVCEFILKYAFGWAVYPFVLIGEGADMQFSPWLNVLWIVVPVGIHAAAYILGGRAEAQRQKRIAEAQEIKGKRRK